jgi:hypothetical protein
MCKNIPHFGMKTSKFYTWIVSKKIYFPREKKQQNKMINRKKSLHTIRKKWENSLSLSLPLSISGRNWKQGRRENKFHFNFSLSPGERKMDWTHGARYNVTELELTSRTNWIDLAQICAMLLGTFSIMDSEWWSN